MTVNKIETQAIIIGAGPAGAGTSIYLTQAGIPHVIIEKETFPRDKVCGDACSGKTAFVLRKANPAWLQEIFDKEQDYTPSHGIVFVAPNGKSLNIPYNPNRQPDEQAPGFTTPRLTFDNYLFEKLPSPQATIYQQSSIKSIDRSGNKVTVVFTKGNEIYEVSAHLIIGADGDKSQVRKQFLDDNSNAKAYAVGLRAYY